MNIKIKFKNLTPRIMWEHMHRVRCRILYLKRMCKSKRKYANLIKIIRNKKGSINVLFFTVDTASWKFDSLYQLMIRNPELQFNPIVVICPVVNNGYDFMLETLNSCEQYFKGKQYKYITTYNPDTDKYYNPRLLNPDIIFYTNPYKGLVHDEYYIDKYQDVLSCYANYFFVAMKEPWTCAEKFHKLLWRYYIGYQLLSDQIEKIVYPDYINSKVVGYPLFDSFRQHQLSRNDWPIESEEKKRIIWAPHHTISNSTEIYAMSTFEKYYDFMLIMADKYKDEVDVVFKPHPLLKPHLYEAEDWGKERTDAYYEKWATGENTAFVDGEYVGLFLASDAMIHDCNSFTVEYLAVNKPAMFLDSGKTDDKLNAVGKEARECYYKGYSEEDIERFIQDVVSGGKDELSERREAFYKNYILPPNGKLAAENIIDDLLTSLGRK